MIGIRIVGAIIIVLGTSAYGWYLSGRLCEKINILTNLKDSLLVMMGHIRYARDGMPSVLNTLATDTANSLLAVFFKCVAEELVHKSGETYSVIWQQGVEKCFLKCCDKDIVNSVKELGELPVYMDATMQLDFLQEKIVRLDERINELKIDFAKKDKVYKSMGISLGMLIVLILI